jgi:dihydroneopterin aldolase
MSPPPSLIEVRPADPGCRLSAIGGTVCAVSDIGRFERRLVDDRRISRPHDQIEIRGLRVYAHHGVHEHEAREGQQFVLDVVLDMDSQIAARTDDIDDTIDYTELVSHVAEMVRSNRFNLIEALGAHIAEQLLSARRVAAVRVTVTKPEVELDEDVDAVAVTVCRARPVHVR